MIARYLGGLARRQRSIQGLRQLVGSATVSVEAGQDVAPDTVIGTSKTGSRVVRLPFEGDEAAWAAVLKRPGESVRRGEPLLRQSSFLGLGNVEYLCPVDGFVEEVLVPQRAVVIREHTAEVRAGISGVVTEVRDGQGVVLEFDGTTMRFFAGWGPPVAGDLTSAGELFAPADVARHITEGHRGKIIWAYSTLCAEAVLEAARIEAAGLIAGSVSLTELQRATVEVRARTGRDNLPLTLLISEGFGSMPMSAAYRRHLAAAVDRAVYLDPGQAGDPAWPADPEVAFSPAPTETAMATPSSVNGAEPLGGPPEPGTPVRILDLEHFGRRATVVGRPRQGRLPTGVTCPVIDVQLEDGIGLTLPIISLEVLAEGSQAED